ncbi:Arm DNA-binding domain-containing protein [Pedobacter lusitanus]|uniref:Arm DNA-binding domain-containing protein n=1 Tax=Pedobacter lusitanus TaxID=1503925 RepID=UPI000696BD5D|nr:Arm DNA-binding domain-containing protein [Pedobacter lusitanus]
MKKHSKLSILFWLWKSKVKKGEKVPIYARITIDSQSAEMSTSRKVLPEFWDNETKTVIGKSAEVKRINSHLKEIEVDLERLYNVLQPRYDQIDPSLLKLL